MITSVVDDTTGEAVCCDDSTFCGAIEFRAVLINRRSP